MKKWVLPAVCILIVLFSFNNSFALVFDPETANINFRFNNPGARANAMGGAFIGLADDATAAFTNPAGLVVLTKPELAVEYKYTDFKFITYDFNGAESSTQNRTSDISFLSFSYPVEKGNITVYRQSLVNSDISFRSTYSKFNVYTYGLSAAYKITNKFSVGGTISFNELDYSVSSGQFVPTSWSGEDWKPGFTASALWTPHDLFNFGVVFRSGPQFKYNASTNTASGSYSFEDKIKIPDVLGAGIASRPLPGLTLSADFNFIWYSQLLDDAKNLYGTKSQSTLAGTIYTNDFKIDYNYEVHAGAEYAFTWKIPMAVRAGYAFKPDHRVYMETNSLSNPVNQYYLNSYKHGDDEHVFCGGFGFVLGNLQLDFAYTNSNLNVEYIASLVWRF